jgi:predicted nuclease of predicted toxin-antitoxin system
MRILLDENVDKRIKDVLSQKGIRVSTTYEAGMSSKTDREILEFASKNEMAVLTHDDDFLKVAEESESHATIIFLPQRIRFREMKNRLKEIDSQIETMNQIIYI